MELQALKRPQLLELKERLLNEKRELDETLERIEGALNGDCYSENPAVFPEDVLSEQFARRLQSHFHAAKQVALSKKVS